MALQKSASKTALLLACPRPFAEDTETEHEEPGEAAVYGTKFHALIAAKLRNPTSTSWQSLLVQVDDDNDLVDHVLSAYRELGEWCKPEGNPFGLAWRVKEVETSRALDLTRSTNGIRKVTLTDADGAHVYEDLAAKELAGTADVILEAETSRGILRCVLDHKTGEDYANEYIAPSQLPQMQALAEMWEADYVAVLHTPRNVPPVIYAEEIPKHSRFRADLWRAYRIIDEGFLRVGPECKFCPARASCPAKQGELIQSATTLVKTTLGVIQARAVTVDRGKFHMMRLELEKLMKQATNELREDVRNGEVIERPDGKVLTLVTSQVERLSKKSILEAYGRVEGEEVLQRLRADGALTSQEEEKLVAK